MDRSSAVLISFVIRISVESQEGSADYARWYGYITHVGSGQREYFNRIDDIGLIMLPYLHEAGVRTDLWSRLSYWLRQRFPALH